LRLVDANVLLYAVDETSTQHRHARSWLDSALNGEEPIGFSWTVVLAFLRLATHRAVFREPLSADDALATMGRWLAQRPASVVEPTSRHLDVLGGLLSESGTAGNLVNDAHLAALAIEYDAVIVSFDADFGRYRGVRREQPGT
jgi:toxin-antitoxin system PIN domain toxin